jgi:probable DNA repair protein
LGAGDTRIDETVVTPTRRLAHHLKRRHDEGCVARGLRVWPTPDILPWSALIERMFQADRQSGRTRLRWLDPHAARLCWERLAQDDPRGSRLVSPDGLGRAAYRSWQVLHDFEIPLEALAGDDSPEVVAFAGWCAQYLHELEGRRWLDAAQAPGLVHAASVASKLRFIGFDALTPAQAAFTQRLSGAGVEVIVESPAIPSTRAGWVVARDRDAEFDLAARWAARRLDGSAGTRLAIVIPGLDRDRERARRALDRVLAPGTTIAGGPAPESMCYELAAARPLVEQAVVAAALEWLGACCNEPDLTACSGLLRSAFCAGAVSEAGQRARLDAWLRAHESQDYSLGRLATRATRHGCPELASALQAAREQLEHWPRRALPSAWSKAFFGVLQALGWPGEGLDSAEHQARTRWHGLLGEFGAHDDVIGPASSGQALGHLRALAEATLFEPQEIRAPLLVIDPETSAGMTFDAAWICGLDSTQWPQAAAPDPFLPRRWQVRMQVPGADAETQTRTARRLFDRLSACAAEVIFSVPQFEGEAPLLPSALLADVSPAPLPDAWRQPSPAQAIFAARVPLDVGIDGAMPALAVGDRSAGGARVLELQAACPFRASAEMRLGARALEEPVLGLDAAARGTLVHEALAGFWSELPDSAALSALSEENRLAQLHSAIATALQPLRATAGPVLSRLLDLEARWLESRALELLQCDLARPAFAIESIEDEHAVDIGGLRLNLRLDRVDRLADGTLAVIDYKTGADAEPRSWVDERPKLPQLPLYVEALGAARVSAVAFGRIRAGHTGYAGLAREDGLFPGCGGPPKGYDSWAGLLEAWHRRLEALAREYLAGDARLAPDPARACQYCPLPGLCRIGDTRLVALRAEGQDE